MSARDELAREVWLADRSRAAAAWGQPSPDEVAAFIECLPEPEGTLQKVIEQAQTEAMAALNDPEGHALVQAIHNRKAEA